MGKMKDRPLSRPATPARDSVMRRPKKSSGVMGGASSRPISRPGGGVPPISRPGYGTRRGF